MFIADAISVPSHFMRETGTGHVQAPVIVAQPAINTEVFHPPRTKDGPGAARFCQEVLGKAPGQLLVGACTTPC